MAIEVNLDAVNDEEGASRLLEPGAYVVRCVDAQVGESTSGKQRVELKHQVVDGEAKDRLVFDDVYVTEAALWRLKRAAKAFGVSWSEAGLEETDFIGRAATVTIEHEEYNEKTRVRVTEYEPAPAEFAEPVVTAGPSGSAVPSDDDIPFAPSRV